MARQVVLGVPVAVRAAALRDNEVAQVDVHLPRAARAYADDRVHVIEIEQLIGVDSDRRDSHTVSHDGHFLAFVCTRERKHTADVVYLYRVLQKALCHQLGAQRVACHDHCLCNLAVLRTDMRSRALFFTHNSVFLKVIIFRDFVITQLRLLSVVFVPLYSFLQIRRSVNADSGCLGHAYPDAVAVLYPSQLFQPLFDLQRTLRQPGDTCQYVCAVGIDTYVPVVPSVGSGNHFAGEHLRFAGPGVPFHFGAVLVLQICRSVLLREGADEGGDVGAFPVETSHEGLYLFGLDEGFVALYVDDYGVLVVLFAPGGRCDGLIRLQTSLCAACMVRTGHYYLAAESLYGVVDAVVVRGYYHGVQHFGRLFIYTADNGLAAYVRQRLARKAGGTVARGYDTYKFHITIYKLQITNHKSPVSTLWSRVIAPAIVFTFIIVIYRRPVLKPFLSLSSCIRHLSGLVTAYWIMLPNCLDCQ